MNDRTAIMRLKEGDIGGLEHLVHSYQIRALRAAYLIVHDHATAEDITQAAFLRVHQNIDQFDEERAFGPWFFRIVTNMALNVLRGSKFIMYFDSDAISDRWTPETCVIAAETTEEILKALQSLSPEQRIVIVQRYYLGLSEAEMSEHGSCPPGTIKWRLHAARKHLRRVLSPLFEPLIPQSSSVDEDPVGGDSHG